MPEGTRDRLPFVIHARMPWRELVTVEASTPRTAELVAQALEDYGATPIRTVDRQRDRITCRTCGRTSHHPEDVRHLYCACCQTFLEGPIDG